MITSEEIVVRIILSIIFGGVLGLERQYHDKPAGFATNTLICAGSTVFTVLSVMSAHSFGGDPARVAAQIVAGVGFLGAGSILREGNKISGLTTAAGIWVVAAIGMAIGYGAFFTAGIATIVVLVVQLFIRKLMNKFDYVKLYDAILIKAKPDFTVIDKITKIVNKHDSEILQEDFYKEEGYLMIRLVLNMSRKTFRATFKELVELDEILSITK